MDIGKYINNYRKGKDLSMQEFADRCGLSKGYISMLEKGRHPQNGKKIVPSIETVQKIASAMHITIDDLLQSIDGDQLIDVSKESRLGCSADVDSLFIERYGQDVFDHALQYSRLDDRDQGKADGFVASLLEDDKYKKGESSDGKAI